MEHNQLFLAAKEGDIATIETLICVKYIDINSRTPEKFFNDVCIAGYHIAMYVCIVITWWLFMHVCIKFQ